MKVRVVLTVDIDREAWATEYGVPVDEVRDDVREYVTNAVKAHLDANGLMCW
jgi:hypothetical protein